METATCDICEGDGLDGDVVCAKCHGSGKVDSTVDSTVEAEVDSTVEAEVDSTVEAEVEAEAGGGYEPTLG